MAAIAINLADLQPKIQVTTNQPTAEPKVSNQKGKKHEVYCYTAEDIKKMLTYFDEKNQPLHKMLLILSLNMARRIGDTLTFKWEQFYKPDGSFRKDLLEFNEQKTDKLANPHINKAVKAAIESYCITVGCDPSKNNYGEYICLQLTGNHAGEVLSYAGHLKALKTAAKAVGIEQNIGTHSARKTFGMINKQLHPTDGDAMEILQSIFNHSDTKVTKRYIGITKQKIDNYYEDVGDYFTDYVLGDKRLAAVNTSVVSIDVNKLRDLITMAYQEGIDNAGDSNPMTHIEAINALMTMLDEESIGSKRIKEA